MKRTVILMAAVLLLVLAESVASAQEKEKEPVKVIASVETKPVPHSGDAADDAAIWIHPTDPSLSTVIGTDKKGGLAVYDLTGELIEYIPDGRMNNVDLRYNFPLGGQQVALVTATDRTDRKHGRLAIYRVNPVTRGLEDVAEPDTYFGGDAYGECMYHSSATGQYYAFNIAANQVQQWELFDNGSGQVDTRLVRTVPISSQGEGCVADDELHYLYVAEEEVGIWKLGAEPDDGLERALIDSVETEGHLIAQVEGLTIYYAGTGGGYLIASSQGGNEFMVYQRGLNNAYVGRFKITNSDNVDAVSHTDGIDVTNMGLDKAFPEGVFVVQDDKNTDPSEYQNFKLVSWRSIASGLNLLIDTSWDPRQEGLRK
jgi:3-phytase